jgi:hypothetical protein
METDLAPVSQTCPSTCQVWGKAVTKDIGRPVLEWVETCWNGGIEDLAHFTNFRLSLIQVNLHPALSSQKSSIGDLIQILLPELLQWLWMPDL